MLRTYRSPAYLAHEGWPCVPVPLCRPASFHLFSHIRVSTGEPPATWWESWQHVQTLCSGSFRKRWIWCTKLCKTVSSHHHSTCAVACRGWIHGNATQHRHSSDAHEHEGTTVNGKQLLLSKEVRGAGGAFPGQELMHFCASPPWRCIAVCQPLSRPLEEPPRYPIARLTDHYSSICMQQTDTFIRFTDHHAGSDKEV